MGFSQLIKSLLKSSYKGWQESCSELGKIFMSGWRPF